LRDNDTLSIRIHTVGADLARDNAILREDIKTGIAATASVMMDRMDATMAQERATNQAFQRSVVDTMGHMCREITSSFASVVAQVNDNSRKTTEAILMSNDIADLTSERESLKRDHFDSQLGGQDNTATERLADLDRRIAEARQHQRSLLTSNQVHLQLPQPTRKRPLEDDQDQRGKDKRPDHREETPIPETVIPPPPNTTAAGISLISCTASEGLTRTGKSYESHCPEVTRTAVIIENVKESPAPLATQHQRPNNFTNRAAVPSPASRSPMHPNPPALLPSLQHLVLLFSTLSSILHYISFAD
jgi:hypothetical protein